VLFRPSSTGAAGLQNCYNSDGQRHAGIAQTARGQE
jgi:hypothetical protein